jgi:hypothetical protein
MDNLTTLGQGAGALILGSLIGQGADAFTTRVAKHRSKLVPLEDGEGPIKDTMFDKLMDLLVHGSLLIIGISLAHSAVPSITKGLPNLVLFNIGVITNSDSLVRNFKSVANEFTS